MPECKVVHGIRAHHGMCLAYFRGAGYSTGFTAHMQAMKDLLRDNPRVRVLDSLDEICAGCPNQDGTLCTDQKKVVEYDRQVLNRCGIAPGTEMDFLELERLVYRNILLPGKRREICADCQWTQLCTGAPDGWEKP